MNRLLIDLLHVNENSGGAAIYSKSVVANLVGRFKPELIIGILVSNKSMEREFSNQKTIFVHFASNRLLRIIFQLLIIPILMKKNKVNIYFNPSVQVPLYKFHSHFYITVIHDLIPFYNASKYQKSRSMYVKWLTRHSISISDRLVFVSKSSLYDAKKLGLLNPEKKIAIAPPASQIIPEFVNKKLTSRAIFAYVGAIEPGKNLGFYLNVWSKYILDFPTDTFNIYSGKEWSNELKNIEKKIINLNIQHSVNIFFSYKTKEEIKQIYKDSTFIVLPSVFEGFGMPLLEGMLFGCLPIASNSSGMSEILGLIEHPLINHNIDEWLGYMLSERQKIIDKSYYDKLQEKLRRAASTFSWEKSAQSIESLINFES